MAETWASHGPCVALVWNPDLVHTRTIIHCRMWAKQKLIVWAGAGPEKNCYVGRRSAFMPPVQAGVPDPWVVQDKLLSLKAEVVETILLIQSSLNEETVCLEVETFHFMVRRPPGHFSSGDIFSQESGGSTGPLCGLYTFGLCARHAQRLSIP